MTPLQNEWRRFQNKAWREAHMYELPTNKEIGTAVAIIGLLVLAGALGLVNAVSAYQIQVTQTELIKTRQALNQRRYTYEKRIVGDTLGPPIPLHRKVSLASR